MSSNPPTTPRIEDLRARLRLDPKARHFYPLAEELRKMGQLDEAEKILRDGLAHHPAYLSAWMSLGRILAEKGNHGEAVETLMKALAIDPGNVVCAKLLATSYLALGDKLEALKKLKLVRAVMPGDEEIDEKIAQLESELAEPPARTAGFAAPPPGAEPAGGEDQPAEPQQAAPDVSTPAEAQPPEAAAADAGAPEAAFEEPPQGERSATAVESEGEPSSAAIEPERENEVSGAEWAPEPRSEDRPAPSPFLTEPDEETEAPPPPPQAEILPEETFAPPFEPDHPVEESIPDAPSAPFTDSADEQPLSERRDDEAVAEDVLPVGSAPFPSEEAAEPFAPEEPSAPADGLGEPWPSEDERAEEPAAIADERTATLTMADLYARQGHDEAAREIYEKVLERDPSNEDVRTRLAALSAPSAAPEHPRNEAAARLERWLAKVGRREL